MERDFLGLSSRESVPMAKEEITNYWCKDAASSQAILVSMEHPFLKNNFAIAGQNMMNGANVKQPPHSVLPIGAGSTEPCVKSSIPAAQLTIFYAGTVNVFTDITPEKAQAIMLLAGNGLSAASNTTQPDVKACISNTGSQSGCGSSSSDEFLAAKTSRGPTTFVSKVHTPKAVNASAMFQSAIPQARKASLARFLEKRKERVMNTSPYNFFKSEDAPLQKSKDANISATTGS